MKKKSEVDHLAFWNKVCETDPAFTKKASADDSAIVTGAFV